MRQPARSTSGVDGTASTSKPSSRASVASARSSLDRTRERVALELGRRVPETGHPREVAVDVELGGERVDLVDGGEPRVPYRLGMIAAERRHQAAQIGIDDRGEVRRRAAAIDAPEMTPLEKRHAAAGAFEQQRGRDAGESAADDRDIHRVVAINRRKARE